MKNLELLGPPTKSERIFDYIADHTIFGKVTCFLGAMLLLVFGAILELLHPGSFSESIEERRKAEEHLRSFYKYRYDDIQKCNSETEKNDLDLKWDMIIRAVTFHLHSGRYTTEEQHRLLKYKDVCKRVFDFFKRNNIDIYSDNFNVEYLTKCVREQDI